MKKLILYFIVLASLLAGSCSDFLDPQPVGQIPEGEAFTNLSDCQAAINGVYALWNSGVLYSGNLTLIPDIECDMAYPVVGYMGEWQPMFSWSYGANTTEATAIYQQLYRVNNAVNFLLEHYPAAVIKEDEKETLDNILAAAFFSRALAMTELVKYYAPAYDPEKADSQIGVQIQDKANDNLAKPERATLAVNYQHILDDLQKAAALCTRDEADAIYITKGAIDALYARVYLYMQNWNEAAKAATRVIANARYALADATALADETNPLSSEFTAMWWIDQSDEIIWKLKYTRTDHPGALGRNFCYRNGLEYEIEYAPAKKVVDMYDNSERAVDLRLYHYCPDLGLPFHVILKYPGNEMLETGSPLYSNMPKVMRLAEMYLIRAEAYARMTPAQSDKANADLHSLREKRILGYVKKDVRGAQLLEAIKDERIKELFMEGHRFYDLKRYGEGFARKPQPLSLAPDDALKIKPDNFRWIWPIPKHETDANLNVEQNFGY